ncbi:MAG: L-histidine N(alpha)-methyltransferase [Solirubrobacteraceae bacterium]|nr:L-histidine N(alpha)-methyltransferase [Solirubrobacteraceae bacterium]
MSDPNRLQALLDHGVEIHAFPESWTALAADVLHGLSSMPKTLPPKWFYDARGSELFDAICEQPEYYPTRTEAAILDEMGARIAADIPAAEVIELGSGSSTKSPLLLDPLDDAGVLRRYVPVDVSAAAIEGAIPGLVDRYPNLEIDARICDFTADLRDLPRPSDEPRLIAFLGSTVGNMQPVEVQAFLAQVRPLLGPDDAVLIGADLVKDADVLEPAYDDAAGVTAEFNRNVLAVINRELQADFVLETFTHEATWNPVLERIESRLRSVCDQVVRIRGLGLEVTFQAGESILTEISRKFRRGGLERAYAQAGLQLRGWYQDPQAWYALSLASPR